MEDSLPLTLSFNLNDGNSVLISATTESGEEFIGVRLSLLDLAFFIQALLFLTGQHSRPGVQYDAWRHGSLLLEGALFVSQDNPDNSLLVRQSLFSQGFLEMALESEDREASIEVEDGQISELIKRLEAFEKKVSLFNSPYYNVPRHSRLEGNTLLH